MNLQIILQILTPLAVAQQPDLVSDLAKIPELLVGLMVAGGILGFAMVLYSRLRNHAGGATTPLEAPPGPRAVASKSITVDLPGIASVDLSEADGFSPSDDFEEPTCFAELPQKRD
jgi:hypothetical protein